MSNHSRRDVLKIGAGCALTGAVGAKGKTAGAKKSMHPLDYGLSFICHESALNSVRFWVESRTRIIDDKAGTVTDYYQCGSCKSENTFGKKDLLYADNYDFMPIFGGDDLLIFRRSAYISDRYRSVVKAKDVWGKPILRLRKPPKVTELTTWKMIRDTTMAAVPIVTQTEITDPKTGLRAIIECPTKTMNIRAEDKMYQVDTGPIAFPDLTKRYERQIDCLRLAFLVFNTPHFTDFVIEQPTPVIEGDKKCQTYHYSSPFSLPAKNRVFAAGTRD